eukprot:2946482-Rhodomonas_salina.2
MLYTLYVSPLPLPTPHHLLAERGTELRWYYTTVVTSATELWSVVLSCGGTAPQEYHHVPDTGALAGRMRCCLQ